MLYYDLRNRAKNKACNDAMSAMNLMIDELIFIGVDK